MFHGKDQITLAVWGSSGVLLVAWVWDNTRLKDLGIARQDAERDGGGLDIQFCVEGDDCSR